MEEPEFTILCKKVNSFAAERGVITVPLIQQEFGINYATARDIVNKLAELKSIEFIGGVEYKPIYVSNPKIQAVRRRIVARADELDPRLGAAAVICAQIGVVSLIDIQRRLGLGYARTARMKDTMLELGLYSKTDDGTKPTFEFTEAEVREAFGMKPAENAQSANSAPSHSDGNNTDKNKHVEDVSESDDEEDDDESFRTIEEILDEIEYEEDIDDCIKVLCELFFVADKDSFWWRLLSVGQTAQSNFPNSFKFYGDIKKRWEGFDKETARQKLCDICNAKIQIYQMNAKLLGNIKTAERLIYEVHEGMQRIVANNPDADTKQLVAVADAEAAACDEADRYCKFIAENIAAELSRFTEERLPFLKAAALITANDCRSRQKVDITYVIDGSNSGALYEYAGNIMTAIERKMDRHFHSAAGDMSATLRERIVCYGNSSADGQNTVTECDFTEMPYGRALLRTRLFDDANKKNNTEKISNGLEGLWTALCSDWTEIPETGGGKHIIIVLTENIAYSPQENPIIRDDDEDYPDDFEKYCATWDGSSGISKISQNGKLLVVCAPKDDGAAKNWEKVTAWNGGHILTDGCNRMTPNSLADYIMFLCDDKKNS